MTQKDEGMAAAYVAENDLWFEQFEEVLWEVGSRQLYFSSDDLNAAGLPRSRALGKSLQLAAKEGFISRVEREVELEPELIVRAFLSVQSNNETAHNAPIALWRSNFYRQR